MTCPVVSIDRSKLVRIDRHAASAACCIAELLVAAVFAVPVRTLRAPGRTNPDVVFARQVAMYLAHVGLGERLGAVAAHFGRDRSTVGHACARIEEERDDAALDETLCALEGALRYWRRPPSGEDS
jgi:chromosomal replication initiation ATPase DnaA